ncbi:hypothetical protein D7S55_26520 [Ralstonia pickettii]|nr:hypothetical protein [Ralstonia pickettii]MBA9984898.1 hypothetical protein [Ralstonia pickettii]MBB0032391.1 hypothetical protein [Ralstonia pickettii]MBB0095166.1 hypothetical protein [Ralstonia pickettii]MBB0202864.1 hypothetical protein [Ralstonia pickettii]
MWLRRSSNIPVSLFEKELAQGKLVLVETKRHVRASILLRHARSRLPSKLTSRVIVIALAHPEGIQICKLAAGAQTSIETVLHLVGRRHLRINSALDFDDNQLVQTRSQSRKRSDAPTD